MALENFFALLYEVAAQFPGWAVAYVLPPITIILGLVFFLALVLQAKLKQDRKRRGVVEYTEEYPYVPRRAARAEVEESLNKHGIKTEADK
ncbi:MAG TPA: hypothetical protein VK465_06975 [Fibrobacteria bacterium]|nr:hypothetical protein [Geothrix sp.]HLP41233.1 hypothetical protein [Fibrobacteria bacterium]